MRNLGAVILILVCLFGISGFSDNGKKEKKARERLEMAQLIQSGQFKFMVRSANSVLGNFNQLSYGYNVVFDSLRVVAYLPYYGRAFNVQYGDEGGVKFDLKADSIDQQWNEKKKLFKISTELDDSRDSYNIYLTAGLDGFAELHINFRNRTWISYSGMIQKLQDKKD